MASSDGLHSAINISPPCQEIIRGTGRGGLTAVSSVAIAVIFVTSIAMTMSLFTLDGLLLYKWTVANPFSLFWSIPVILTFIAADTGLTVLISKIAAKAIEHVGKAAQDNANKCLAHFRAIG